jgi:hypothetical protein
MNGNGKRRVAVRFVPWQYFIDASTRVKKPPKPRVALADAIA